MVKAAKKVLYRGEQPGLETMVAVSRDGGETWAPLPHRCEPGDCHSPTGFNWGYRGSGPADLAKNLLWDLWGREPHPAEAFHFKEAQIAMLTTRQWTLDADLIEWVMSQQRGANGA